ncbi:MAG: hypothetical protein AB9897_08860 [Anaerolineaceae bacterium]
MFNSDTELFFPIRVIPTLKQARGAEWDALIDRVTSIEASQVEKIAFSNLIIKLAACQGCDADSFRAMRGCTQCSRIVVKRYKGSDAELLEQFEQCKKEVAEFVEKRY